MQGRARIIGAAALTALLLLVIPASAQARNMVCQVSAGGSFAPAMAPSGGSGTYDVSTGGLANRTNCGISAPLNIFDGRLTTRGTFTATACGTGLLVGNPTAGATVLDIGVARLGGLQGPIINRLEYTIELRNWQGLLRVTRVNGVVEEGGDDIDGVLAFVPQHGCVSQPVEWFTFDGVVSLAW